jgi:2-(1,2-epoxy-1,2-dihydrophenyl)acetyl-CoA isomerase
LEVGTTELGGVRGEASFFNAGADRRLAFRVDVEMRLEDLETNKDRRVGVMFKAPCAGDYWRSQKTSSTAGALRRQRTCDLVTTGAVDKLRDNQTAELKMGLAISTTSFTCDIQDGLAHMVFTRPDRGNPVDGEFCREFSLAMAELSEREDVRAVLISAQGKLFSVGGDIAAFERQGSGLPALVKHWTADLHAAIVRMRRMRAPVVVAVHGHVAGGSVSLMAAADLVVIGKSARITAAFAKIGFSPDTGSTVTLTARMGSARAKRFFLLSETLDAAAAQATGLVDIVVDDNRVLAEAERIGRELAAGPTEAYGGIKRLFLQASSRSFESQLEDEAQTLAAISKTADAREGIKAFREKRSPNFQGR